MYDTGYDYKIGDIRGVTSIKIPLENLRSETMDGFYEIIFIFWSSILFLLILIYFAIKRLTIQDIEQKIVLEEEIKNKTADLEEQKENLQIINKNQQHLFSILKTIADCNQVLITANDVNELIENTAVSMQLNQAFAGVKILLFENNRLVVKSSVGLDEDFDVMHLEKDVFENNNFLLLNKFDTNLPKECLQKIKKNNITEIYSIPLRKNKYATQAIGVLTIYSTEENGLSRQEQEMVNDLAGDIGFAINSFSQRDAINRLSHYDVLTSLPNRKFFKEYLTQALLSSKNSSNYGAVLFLDFDNFKNINVLMGEDSGDTILIEITNRLTSDIDKVSIVARQGSDKFLILLEDISSKEDESAIIATEISKHIQDIIKEPFIVKNQPIYLTCSIGIILYFHNQSNPNLLLERAEYAMRTAKSEGKNTIMFFDESLQGMTKSRSLMIQQMKDAVLSNQFFIHYQKQIDMNENIVGVEALIRWEHPTLGFVSPAEFIPLAEESGTIKEIGKFVLDCVAKELIKWGKDEIKKEWRISVNVSPLQFKEENFVDDLNALITSSKINPNRLRVELTEGVFIDKQKDAMNKIEKLHRLGVSTSIDDFGTGYSSLAYLKHLKINELKIDQSFVSGLESNSSDETIIKTIIMMGEEFGFDVIAEGVETLEQFNKLKKLGCKYFQGYLFAKPCSIEEL